MKQNLKIIAGKTSKPSLAERIKFLLFGSSPKLTIVIPKDAKFLSIEK